MERTDKALDLYEQALSIQREVDDRAGEAITCFNMAMFSRDLGQPRSAPWNCAPGCALGATRLRPDYSQDAVLLAEW
jgi:hypothetical protein